MKMLLILSIILAVLAAYFVFNAEKSISLKNAGNAVPAGIDIAKFILNKALNQSGTIKSGINDVLQSKLIEEIKTKAGEIKSKVLNGAVNLIKKPIENKIVETFCPSTGKSNK